MKKVISMAAFVCVAAVAGCKKDDSTSDEEKKDCLITKAVDVQKWQDGATYVTTFNYTYDSKKNVTRVLADGIDANRFGDKVPTQFVYNLTYAGNDIKVENATGNEWNFTKNSEGRIIQKTEGDSGVQTFEYNADGTLKLSKWSEGGIHYSTTTYVWQNGNLVTATYKSEQSGDTEVTSFNYYTDKDALPSFDYLYAYAEDWKSFGYSVVPFIQNYSTGLYGKTSKNLLKTIVEDGHQLNFTYTEKNSSTFEMKIENTKLKRFDTIELTYSCN